MSRRSDTELQPPAKGHNYDPVARAEFIRSYYDERLAIEADKQAFAEKIKKRQQKNAKLIQGISMPAADTASGYRIFKLKAAIANAENEEDRAKAERALEIALGNQVEAIAAANAEEGTKGQLDFDELLKARDDSLEAAAGDEDDAQVEEAESSKKGRRAGGKKVH